MMDSLDRKQAGPGKRWDLLRRFVCEDGAQDVIEYALLAAFIGIAGILTLTALGDDIQTTYKSWIDPDAGTPSLWIPDEPPPPAP